ncbi:LytR family transcriptional regulator [bacterium]|nr:MAG: LytR family transcriptional regulator [bacterium]
MIGWGVDERGRQHAVSKVIRRGARADMIMVARLDFKKHAITGLSIPRDTACRLDGETRKINAFYSIAPKGESESYMVRAVEHTLPGVHIDRTIAINYDAFQELVDTVGGVPVVVPKGSEGEGLQYDDNAGDLHIHLSPGKQVLDGKDAMGYVRFRHDSESDFGRQQRQKEFLASFKSSIFKNLGKLPEIAEQGKAVMSNALTDDEIIAVVAFARKVPQSSIKLGTLPTYPRGRLLRVVESKRDDALREYGLLTDSTLTAAVER